MGDVPYTYDGGLEGLFVLLGRALVDGEAPASVSRRFCSGGRAANAEGDLFASPTPLDDPAPRLSVPEDALLVEFGALPSADAAPAAAARTAMQAAEAERTLASYSPWARLDFIYAWMSELPIEGEMLAFALRVVSAGREKRRDGAGVEAVRDAAEAARTDRGDPAVRATLSAVQKVTREEHRLIGLLRFSELASGRLVARCACDHAVLPALAGHFTSRFGGRNWAIVDERRGLALVCEPPDPPRLLPAEQAQCDLGTGADRGDEWEALWRDYHRTIAIDSRANPGLQRRLMPVRYWKYLTELR